MKDVIRFLNKFSNTYDDAIVRYRSKLILQLFASSEEDNSLASLSDFEIQSIILKVQQVTEEKNQFEEPIEDALKKNQHIFLIGQAGSGKTTFLKLLASISARGFLRQVSNSPVLLSLNSILTIEHSILKAIQQEIETVSNTSIDQLELTKSLEKGNILLLLDGLNESLKRKEAIEEVKKFSQTFPKTNIVITGRSKDAEDLGFTIFQIAPLSKREIHQLIILMFSDEPNAGASFWRALQENSSLMSFASNPIMFWLLSEMFRNQKQLHNEKSALLNQFSTKFITSRVKSLSNSSNKIAEEIALWMLLNKRNIFSEDELQQIAIDKKGSSLDLEKSINELYRQSVFSETGRGKVRFTNLIFQDYFCTKALLEFQEDKLVQFVVDHADENKWHSVFTLLASQLTDASKIIESLISQDDQESCLLAAKLLTEGAKAKNELYEKVINKLCGFLDQREPQAALSASSFLIKFKEPFVDKKCYSLLFEKKDDPLATVSLAYVLVARGREDLNFYKILSTTLRDPNEHVRFQTCKALGAWNTEVSTELLIQSLMTEKHSKVLEQVLSALFIRNDLSDKMSSSSLAQLLYELKNMKYSSKKNNQLREWIDLLERKLTNEQLSSKEG